MSDQWSQSSSGCQQHTETEVFSWVVELQAASLRPEGQAVRAAFCKLYFCKGVAIYHRGMNLIL
jgi:hypothetical protein